MSAVSRVQAGYSRAETTSSRTRCTTKISRVRHHTIETFAQRNPTAYSYVRVLLMAAATERARAAASTRSVLRFPLPIMSERLRTGCRCRSLSVVGHGRQRCYNSSIEDRCFLTRQGILIPQHTIFSAWGEVSQEVKPPSPKNSIPKKNTCS